MSDKPERTTYLMRQWRDRALEAEADLEAEEDRANENATLVHKARAERDALAQAMWDVRTAFGFDPDGDERYHGSSYQRIADEFRRDMNDALDEYEAGR